CILPAFPPSCEFPPGQRAPQPNCRKVGQPTSHAKPPVTLAVRLLLAFGFVAILATALVGVSLRERSRDIIEADFASRIDAAAGGVAQELAYEAESLRGLWAPLCEHDTFVDKALLELERAHGDTTALDTERLIGIRHFIPEEAGSRGLDELALVTGDGV